MKAQNQCKWMIIILLILASCQKDEEVFPLNYCEECESFTGVYTLVRVETPSCRYTPLDMPCLQGMVVIDGKIEITEFGEFRQELLFWTGEGSISDTTNTLRCCKTLLFEVVNDSTIKVNYEQCGKPYFTYACFNNRELKHEYSYQCYRYFEKVY